MLSQPAIAAKKQVSPAVTPSELQSQIMSFADRFVARLGGASIDYLLLKGYTNDPLVRFAVNGRKLHACAAAVSIAAGPNPEVALLDMVAMVSLLKLSTRDVWIPKKYTPNGQIFLDVFNELERDIWSIASKVLSAEQARDLRELIATWHAENVGRIVSVTSIRFSDFAGKRRESTLVQNGKPKGFLKSVQEANKEIEQTRVLAERTVFLVERQPTLMRWQVEQVFYDLAMEPEFNKIINSTVDLSSMAKHLATTVEKMPAIISAERKAAIKQAFRELSKERTETISQAITEISRERRALIDQTSERILEKAFYLGLILILVLLLGAIVARLIYRYLEISLFERAGKKPPPSVAKA